jgi:hypothetical protein
MLSIVMLSDMAPADKANRAQLSMFMLSIIILSIAMLSIVMPSGMAPADKANLVQHLSLFVWRWRGKKIITSTPDLEKNQKILNAWSATNDSHSEDFSNGIMNFITRREEAALNVNFAGKSF